MATANLRTFETPDTLARAAAETLLDRAETGLRERGTFSVALSGGSTPKRMYTFLSEMDRSRELLSQIDFFWGDERHVPPEHPDSNFGAAQAGLFEPLGISDKNIHRIKAEMKNADDAATDYEAAIIKVVGPQPSFDLIFLGMGPDGHTASIFPGTSAVTETEKIVTATWVEKLNAHRITLTYPTINHAQTVIFLITGEDKAAPLKEVLHGTRNPNLYPSQLIQPEPGELIWFLDDKAGALV